uniref:CCHC-type domain-containing protein n=5 Tax=Manihot esculenta TaxID=3983 RepID=A0A2C9WLQ8_MANES
MTCSGFTAIESHVFAIRIRTRISDLYSMRNDYLIFLLTKKPTLWRIEIERFTTDHSSLPFLRTSSSPFLHSSIERLFASAVRSPEFKMPATAGRVRMPANNRVHSSAALQTHGIWQSAIGYDPYAPNKDDSKTSSQQKPSNAEPEAENAYASFQGLLALARITGSNADEARGACKRCGRVGHLSYQCRNFLSIKDDNKEKDPEALQAAVLSGLEKIKGNGKIGVGSKEESEEEEEESETSDSEVDSEIERIIAERYGKKGSSKRNSSRKEENSDEGSDSDSGERKKRGRSKKRRSKKRGISDSEDEDEGKRKRRREKRRTGDSEDEDEGKKKRRRREKRRKRDESSSEEEDRRRHKRKSRKDKRRGRSHRYSDDSESDASDDSGKRHRRKSRKPASRSDSDLSASDDSRVGRVTKRSEKRSKKPHHEEDN